jgi:hypothetical protein
VRRSQAVVAADVRKRLPHSQEGPLASALQETKQGFCRIGEYLHHVAFAFDDLGGEPGYLFHHGEVIEVLLALDWVHLGEFLDRLLGEVVEASNLQCPLERRDKLTSKITVGESNLLTVSEPPKVELGYQVVLFFHSDNDGSPRRRNRRPIALGEWPSAGPPPASKTVS